MSWSKIVGNGYRYTCYYVRTGLEGGGYWAGNIFCFGAAVLSASANVIDESISAGYYAKGVLDGTVNLNVTIIKFARSIIHSFPYSQHAYSQGSFTDSLNDSIHPLTLQMYALLALGIGILLKVLSSLIGLYYRGYYQREELRKEGVDIPMPSKQEYGYRIGREVTSALLIAFTSSTILQTILYFTPWTNRSYKYTDPENGSDHICNSHYCGPLKHVNRTIVENIYEIVNATFFGVKEPISINATFQGDVQGKLGAGITIKPRHHYKGTGIIPTSILGFFASLGNAYFDKKVNDAEDKRLVRAGKNAPASPSIEHAQNDEPNEYDLLLNTETENGHHVVSTNHETVLNLQN